MDKEALRALYREWVEDYCNVKFGVNPPPGVVLAIDELVRLDPMSYRVTSEKLSDMSRTFTDNGGRIPAYIINWFEPYRRVHLVSDKKKRDYKDGR